MASVHEDFLIPAGFRLETAGYPVSRIWTVETITGFLYSTSYASPQVLGDRKDDFERDLRAELLALAPDGLFPETLAFSLMIGHKDRSAAAARPPGLPG